MLYESLYFQLQGMMCSSCEGIVEHCVQELISEFPEIQSASASTAFSLLTITLKQDTSLERRRMIAQRIVEELSQIYSIQPTDNPFISPEVKEDAQGFWLKGGLNLGLAAFFHLAPHLFSGMMALMTGGTGIVFHAMAFLLMVYSGGALFKDAWLHLKKGHYNMNSLISLSTLMAFATSLLTVLFPLVFGAGLFTLMPVFMLLGLSNIGRGIRYLVEQKASRLTRQLESLFIENQPKIAHLKEGESYRDVPFEAVKPKDCILVKSGERFPVDGRLLSKESWVNQKNMTGESLLVKKTDNDLVLAGTVNTHRDVLIEATTKGQDNTLMRILWQAKQARMMRAESLGWVDAIAQKFVPGVIAFAVLSGLGTLYFSLSPLFAVEAMIRVLVCACPCALGLAAPMSYGIGLYTMLTQGILVKQSDSIKNLTEVDTIAFDKTGTLTEPQVETSYVPAGPNQKDALAMAASLESHFSNHPIAKSIVSHYSGPLLSIEKPSLHPTKQAVTGLYNNKTIFVGNLAVCRSLNPSNLSAFDDEIERIQQSGLTPTFIVIDDVVCGLLGLKHTLKPHVAPLLHALKKQGKKLILITGDTLPATESAIRGLPFDHVYAEQTAGQKRDVVQGYQDKGHKVAFVGDGINDLEAAAISHVSIAVQAWAHLASAAQISLRGELKDLLKCFESAKIIQKNIQQNLIWTFFYNGISLVFASGMLYPWLGFTLNPAVFALTMMASSIVVIGNALRLPSLLKVDLQASPSQAAPFFAEQDAVKESLLAKSGRQKIVFDQEYRSNFSEKSHSRSINPTL